MQVTFPRANAEEGAAVECGGGKSQTWLTFLKNHLGESWAMDFFTVPTLTFRSLYVFVVLDHARRQVIHFNVTDHPTMRWTIQQLEEAMPFGEQPRFIFRDNDGLYGEKVPAFLKSCGIEEIRSANCSPWQNPYVERFIGTLRRELLDHVIPLNEGHLRALLREFIDGYYHPARPHQGLKGEVPIPGSAPKIVSATPVAEDDADADHLLAILIAGGLHHRYVRLAA